MSSRFALIITAALLSLDPRLSAAQGTRTPTPAYIASWATSVQAAEPGNGQPPLDAAKLSDVTVRQIVHLSAGGTGVRLVLSNAFGTAPLTIDDVHIAQAVKPGLAATVPGTDHLVLFGAEAQNAVTLLIGAPYASLPVAMPVAAGSDLAISFHLQQPPPGQTAHPGARATSFLLHGDHAADGDLPGAEAVVRWFQIAEVDTVAPPSGQTVVAFGDSITDGHGSTTDRNDRWPDLLAHRLQAAGMAATAVANQGIGGNHLLTNGLGESALERLDRDLFSLPAVHTVILLEGINDLGALARNPNATPAMHSALLLRLEGAYLQILLRAHAHGMKVLGGTLTPFVGSDYYHPDAASEADRQALNTWIRQSGHFDGLNDFDKAIRDPAHPERLLPRFDSGDHLHPGPAGYQAMADAVPLALLQ